MARSNLVRRVIAWSMAAIIVVSVLYWGVTHERLPENIRIATAASGGLYHEFGERLGTELSQLRGVDITVLVTEGSPENRRRLLAGTAELGVLQAGSVSMDGLVALAPLYRDVMLVVVRNELEIDHIRALAGKRVAIGLHSSGMQVSALELLKHYHVALDSLDTQERYFLDLLDDATLDAAIITTGLLNPDLETLLGAGEFRLLPVGQADAFCVRHPSFEPIVVPAGLFGVDEPVPPTALSTVATTAFLAAQEGASALLVERSLDALYRGGVQSRISTLITPAEAQKWRTVPMHPAAQTYFDPYAGLDTLTSFMESLAAGKELLFAFGAGLYLLWDRRRRNQEREHAREMRVMRDRLESLLTETARIERAQMESVDPVELKEYLDEVTRIKLRALEELTHEDLRGDRLFLIFLMQCGNVISKIQAKITARSLRGS